MPVIASLGRWAARSPLHDPGLRMSHVSVLMSLQTLISPERAEGLDARIGFRLGEASYVATVHDGRLDVDRREAQDCDVTFTGSAERGRRRDPRRRAVRDDRGRRRHGAGETFRDARFRCPRKVVAS